MGWNHQYIQNTLALLERPGAAEVEICVQFPLLQGGVSNKVIVSMGEQTTGHSGHLHCSWKQGNTQCLAKTPTKTGMLTALGHHHGQHLTSRTRTDKDDLCPSPGPCICVPRTHVCLFLEEGCLSLSVHACRLGPIELDLIPCRGERGREP